MVIKSIERAIDKVKQREGFEGDDFKNKVLRHLQFSLDITKGDYGKILDLKAISEQSYSAMEAYMTAQEMADKKLEESQKQYEIDFYEFAAKHNINIIESESDLSKKMKISNEVFEYYKKYYLIFFKVYINDVYLHQALEKNDIGAIDQSSEALLISAKEGLQQLNTVPVYKKDKSVLIANKNLFDFLIDKAQNKIPVITDFLVLNENFNKIKETFERTPARKRTKKQVDDFNKKVNEINKKIQAYNKTNKLITNKTNLLLQKVNAANSNFLSKHIPKD